ncbi:glycerophosphodiester phosphodiesterase family protein [Lactobacillus crispatus]|nr:glycerophosphodiester phosphodiesterase family protein [Lactobacillus crispatus]
MCFFVQTNHTRKELLFLMFKEINLRNYSSLHKLFYSLLLMDMVIVLHVLMVLKAIA